jgi:hypothetical protein
MFSQLMYSSGENGGEVNREYCGLLRCSGTLIFLVLIYVLSTTLKTFCSNINFRRVLNSSPTLNAAIFQVIAACSPHVNRRFEGYVTSLFRGKNQLCKKQTSSPSPGDMFLQNIGSHADLMMLSQTMAAFVTAAARTFRPCIFPSFTPVRPTINKRRNGTRW